MLQYKYKEAYQKQKGHHIGAQSLEDDPKLVHSMKVAKMQSHREYKKAYEKQKTEMHLPLDMMDLVSAKKCQSLISSIGYKNIPHEWKFLTDNMSVALAKKAKEILSDSEYKADLEWIREMGWIPLGSLDHKKAQRAAEILSEKKYRQHPSTIEFTSIPDLPDIVQAK
uniref:Nebulin n=1 Tax=Eptatretus burgeri TaxID=7764 RepID=A0A8C4Q1G0_EPTBU